MINKYNSNLAFVDLLFNLILGFAFLFTVAFLLINDPTEEEVVEAKAEYMIVMSWDGEKDVDMDLWVEGPEGLVGFRSPNVGFVNLDRDDLGHRNDKINAGTAQERIVYVNREIINIRGFQQGEYTVNGHMFFEHEPEGKERVEVEVEVLKLNPFEEVFAGTKTFAWRGQEQTFVRFSMMPSGRYFNIHELPKNLVMKPQTSSAVTMNFQAGSRGLTTPPMGPSGTSMGAGPNQPDDERRRSAKSGRRAYIDSNDWGDGDPAYSGGGGY